MTVAYVEKRIRQIAAIQDDDERAHALEDKLWKQVLRAIANGASDGQALAAAAIKTKKLKFCRWYA